MISFAGFFKLWLPLIAALFLSTPLLAQSNVRIKDLDVSIEDQLTPQFDVNGPTAKRGNPENWIEVEAEIVLEMAQNEEWTDSITIRWYLGMVDENNQGIILPTEVTYVDVPAGEEIYASVYLAPRSIRRITGRERVLANQIEKWAIVIVDSRGVVLGAMDDRKKYNPQQLGELWINNNSLARREGVLRPKSQTPFAPLWSDYHLEEQSVPRR